MSSSSSSSTACTFLGYGFLLRQTDWKCPFLLQLPQIVTLAGQYFLSWFWCPYQKQGRSFLENSFFCWTYRLVVCCLLLVGRAWLTNVINFVLSLYPTDYGSILFSCFGLSANASSGCESEVRFSLWAVGQCIIEDSNNNSVSYKFILQSSVLTIFGEAV